MISRQRQVRDHDVRLRRTGTIHDRQAAVISLGRLRETCRGHFTLLPLAEMLLQLVKKVISSDVPYGDEYGIVRCQSFAVKREDVLTSQLFNFFRRRSYACIRMLSVENSRSLLIGQKARLRTLIFE